MQFGKAYIGRTFKTARNLWLPGRTSPIQPGTLVKLRAVDPENELVEIEGKDADQKDFTATVTETLLLLDDGKAQAADGKAVELKAPTATENDAPASAKDYKDKLKPVTSSTVAALGFFPTAEGADTGELVVQFKGGETYRYRGVARETWALVNSAESVGKAINALIKKNPATPAEKLAKK